LDDRVSETDFADVYCKCEHGIYNQRRIDILIKFGNNKFVVAIENKVWAIDQNNQLKDYNKYLNKEFPENYCLLYLTPFNKAPSVGSIEKTSFKELKEKGLTKLISYKEDIIACVHDWALQCQAERVRVFLLDFEQYLKKEFLGQTFMNENKTIATYAVESSENVEIAFATFNAIDEIKRRLLHKLKLQIEAIAIENNLEKHIDKTLGLNYNYTRFSFFRKSWKYVNISFQFGAKNANDFKYGLSLKGTGGNENIPVSIPEELKKSILQEFNISQIKGEWWLFANDFENDIKNWGNQPKPWMEIQNEQMKKRIDIIVKDFLSKIGSQEL